MVVIVGTEGSINERMSVQEEGLIHRTRRTRKKGKRNGWDDHPVIDYKKSYLNVMTYEERPNERQFQNGK